MVEEEKYCVDVLKQTYAVRRAIEKLESLLLDGHLHTCVVQGVKDGREEQVVGELLELYSLNMEGQKYVNQDTKEDSSACGRDDLCLLRLPR